MVKNKEEEKLLIKLKVFMKVNGLMISVMDLDFISMQTEIFMKELFPKDKNKVLEFKSLKMGIFTEENIKMINLNPLW